MTKPSLSDTQQLTLGEAPWWALMEDAEGGLHVVPWDTSVPGVARGHVVGECWCQPDTDFVPGWGSMLLHREPTWPNSSESVN